MIEIDSLYVRMIWDIVNSHIHTFSELSDEAICLWILRAIKDQIHLSSEECRKLEAYISSRTGLIRDIAAF